MPRISKPIPNLAGGRNGGIHPVNIADNEMTDLVNFFVDGDSLAPRRGTRKQSDRFRDIAYPSDDPVNTLLSMFSYLIPDGSEFVFIIGLPDRFLKLRVEEGVITTFTGLSRLSHFPAGPGVPSLAQYGPPGYPTGALLSPATTFEHWKFAQVKGIWYAVSESGSRLIRGDDTSFDSAGIEAPTVAPTIADGGAGSMTAADYYAVYTYYNSATADESAPSPTSSVLTLGSGRQVAASALAASTNPQVDTIRIWLTQPGQQGAYFLAGEVANGTASLTFSVTPNELVILLDDTNDVPPAILYDLEVFDDSMFVTDGDFIYKSKYLQYETFDSSDDGIPVSSEDGHKVKMLLAHGKKLVAGKTNRIATFTPTGTGEYTPGVISNKYGIRSKFAAKSVEGALIFYDGFVFRRSDSFGEPYEISGQRIKDIMRDVPADKRDDLFAEVFPRQDLYVVIVPQPNDTVVVLAYNYKDTQNNPWSLFEFEVAPTFLAEGFDTAGNREIYAIRTDNSVVELLDENSDHDTDAIGNETDINYRWKSKAFQGERPTDLVSVEDLSLLTTQQGATAEVQLYNDLAAAPTKTDSLYLFSDRSPWKWSSINTKDDDATMVQVGFDYTGVLPRDFRITGMVLNMIARAGKSLDRPGTT